MRGSMHETYKMRSPMPDTHGNPLDEETLACIETCLNCHRACAQTIPYCLELGGPNAMCDHIRLMMDCAEICLTAIAAHFHDARIAAAPLFVCGASRRSLAEPPSYMKIARKMSDDMRMLAMRR